MKIYKVKVTYSNMGDIQERTSIFSSFDMAITEFNSYKEDPNTETAEVFKMEDENGKFYVVEVVASYS
jgi:hypothetical protein